MRAEGRKSRAAAAGRAVALLLPLLAATSCKPMDDAMAMVFGRTMRNQPSFDPYENTRPPAEGSVPFAAGNFPARVGELNVGQPEPALYDVPPFTAADMARGAEAVASSLQNPVPATPESLARGELLYARYCAVCHGPQGVSAQAPIAEKLQVMTAFNLATGAATGFSDGYIYGMIRVGRGVMPEYGHRVSHFDRWHIVNHVRQLQRAAGASAAGAESGQAPGASGAVPGADGGAPGTDTAGGA